MTNGHVFDLNNYLKKWNNKECFINNHSFEVETLGDWVSSNDSERILDFKYKFMYVKCKECNIDKIIK